MHRAEVNNIGKSRQSGEPFSVPQLDALIDASRECWDMALVYGERYGYRNSQTTVLAPTGTIGFMMDCDTTGIEPDLALVKYKKLVGGGMIKIVNNTVPAALFKLGYSDDEVNAIVSYIDATGTIEGAPGIKPEHLAVFDCSFKPAKGTRSIHYMGHIKMMAAAQPFLSGAISKTVNLPHEATVEDVAEAYAESWRQGIKAVAIYRDGSKGTQPLNTSMDAKHEPSALDAAGSRVLAQLAAGSPPPKPTSRRSKPRSATKLEVTARQLSPPPPRPFSRRSTRSPRPPPFRCLRLDSLLNAGRAPPGAGPQRVRRAPSAIACRKSAPPSPTNSPSPATRATSPSASTPTASPAKSSSAWPKKAPPSPASWTPSPPPSRSPCSTACSSACSAKNSPTPASSLPAGPATSRSVTPRASWTISSAGSICASSPASSSPSSPA